MIALAKVQNKFDITKEKTRKVFLCPKTICMKRRRFKPLTSSSVDNPSIIHRFDGQAMEQQWSSNGRKAEE